MSRWREFHSIGPQTRQARSACRPRVSKPFLPRLADRDLQTQRRRSTGLLTNTFTAIINGHKQSRIDELLPWNFRLQWDSPAATMRLDKPSTKTKADFSILRRRIWWQARDICAIARSKPEGLFHPVDFYPWRFVFLQDYDAGDIVTPCARSPKSLHHRAMNKQVATKVDAIWFSRSRRVSIGITPFCIGEIPCRR